MNIDSMVTAQEKKKVNSSSDSTSSASSDQRSLNGSGSNAQKSTTQTGTKLRNIQPKPLKRGLTEDYRISQYPQPQMYFNVGSPVMVSASLQTPPPLTASRTNSLIQTSPSPRGSILTHRNSMIPTYTPVPKLPLPPLALSKIPIPAAPKLASPPTKRQKQDPKKSRPINAFFLYQKDKRPLAMTMVPNHDTRAASKLMAEMWKNETESVKDEYKRRAGEVKVMYDAQKEAQKRFDLFPGYIPVSVPINQSHVASVPRQMPLNEKTALNNLFIEAEKQERKVEDAEMNLFNLALIAEVDSMRTKRDKRDDLAI